jgi:hypothetical protein
MQGLFILAMGVGVACNCQVVSRGLPPYSLWKISSPLTHLAENWSLALVKNENFQLRKGFIFGDIIILNIYEGTFLFPV